MSLQKQGYREGALGGVAGCLPWYWQIDRFIFSNTNRYNKLGQSWAKLSGNLPQNKDSEDNLKNQIFSLNFSVSLIKSKFHNITQLREAIIRKINYIRGIFPRGGGVRSFHGNN